MPLETKLTVQEMKNISGWYHENSKEMSPGERRMAAQMWLMTIAIVQRLEDPKSGSCNPVIGFVCAALLGVVLATEAAVFLL